MNQRTIIAFALAPLIVPVLMLLLFWIIYPFNVEGDISSAAFVIVVTAYAYFATLFFGVPSYAFLVLRNWTSFKYAPMTGACIGIGPVVVLAMFGKQSIIELLVALATFSVVVGAAIFAVVWLVARPDLPPDQT